MLLCMNDNIFRLFLVLAYIITKLFTFQVLFAQFYIFLPVHDAHSHWVFLFLSNHPFLSQIILYQFDNFSCYADLLQGIFLTRNIKGIIITLMTYNLQLGYFLPISLGKISLLT